MKLVTTGSVVSEEKSFEIADRPTTDNTVCLSYELHRAFGSGELKSHANVDYHELTY